jgi:L-alanine-DL-glutamate epimerase-like enolase superfamily enzyme
VAAALARAPTSHTLCAADVRHVLTLVESGVRTIKVKVEDPERARHFVRHLRTKVSGERLAVRLDANGCLDALSSRWLLRNFVAGDVELIEQPVDRADLEGLRSLARDFPHVIVCADESLIDPALREAVLTSAEPLGFIWKPQAVGGAVAVIDAVKRRPDCLHIVTGFLDTPVAHTYAAACARVVDAVTGVARAHGLTSMARLG